MDKELKREALRQYVHYFRIWFVLVGIAIALFIGVSVIKSHKEVAERQNMLAPAERVFDYADVLTDGEEAALRQLIAEKEAKAQIDIVLVTISEDMESDGTSWEYSMQNYADDFYDFGNYGYNMADGDGILLLDNWYDGQAGSHISTCGKVERRFSDSDIDRLLDGIYAYIDTNPARAYEAYIEQSARMMSGIGGSKQAKGNGIILCMIIPLFVAASYGISNSKSKKATDTTNAVTFVQNHRPNLVSKSDDFLRKNVTSVRINTESSGSHSSGGGGGHHVSHSGVSHGGGSRRR